MTHDPRCGDACPCRKLKLEGGRTHIFSTNSWVEYVVVDETTSILVFEVRRVEDDGDADGAGEDGTLEKRS